jgi:hypothetical protein
MLKQQAQEIKDLLTKGMLQTQVLIHIFEEKKCFYPSIFPYRLTGISQPKD